MGKGDAPRPKSVREDEYAERYARTFGGPLKLGTKVPPYGKVAAVHHDGTERFYHLLDASGAVAVMPADVIEKMVAEGQKKRDDRRDNDRHPALPL